jgi:very-short-patch-repair endonuclease
LIAVGLTPREIERAVELKRLHRIHESVYAVGHRALTKHGRYMAAVLSAGDDAVLSHRSAADLWDLRASREGEIDVIANTHRRGGGDVVPHRTALEPGDITTCQGIPTTTPLRTIIDLAAVAREHQLEPAIRQAVYRRLTTTALLAEAVHNRPGQRGTKRLRDVLIHLGEAPGETKSRLEDRFLRFLRRHRLPMPELNVPMQIAGNPIEADCLWREQRVIIELDGRDGHDSTPAFESDRSRDLALTAAGWRPGRVTSRRLRFDADALAKELRVLLG